MVGGRWWFLVLGGWFWWGLFLVMWLPPGCWGLVVVRPGGVPAFLFGRMRLRLPFRNSMSLVSERGCRIEADAPIHAQIDGDYFGQASWFRVGLAEQELLLRFPGE